VARARVVCTLLANCILIPALGFFLVHDPLNPEARIGILLRAAIPGTPIALQFTRQAKTRLAFTAAVTFVLSAVSLAMTPLVVQVMPEVARRSERPLILGRHRSIHRGTARRWCVGSTALAEVAAMLVLPLGLIATAAFWFLMSETRLLRCAAFNAIRGGGAVAAMLLLLLAMLIGWCIGGLGRESRRVLATTTGRYAYRHCCVVHCPVLLYGHQCIYGPDYLPRAHGAHKSNLLPGFCGVAEVVACERKCWAIKYLRIKSNPELTQLSFGIPLEQVRLDNTK